MNRSQEWVLRVVGGVAAFASFVYGVDKEEVLWAVVFPAIVIGALAFWGLRNRISPPTGLAASLERLVRMKELGTLSEAEFNLAKRKLLEVVGAERSGDTPAQ